MASNGLIKNWIQYLKNNQIVGPSDPKTGKLNYKRSVTTSDVVHFLQIGSDYQDNEINSAIENVVSNKPQKQDTATQQNTQQEPHTPDQIRKQKQAAAIQHARGEMGDTATDRQPQTQQQSPEEIRKQKQAAAAASAQKNMASNPLPEPKKQPETPDQIRKRKQAAATQLARSDMTDIEPEQDPPQAARSRTGGKKAGVLSQTPGAIRKRQARANRKAALNEDFVDEPGEELSEKDVENIFAALGDINNTEKIHNSRDSDAEVEQLKSFISNKMTADHRKQLWDLLKQDSINEDTISKQDVKYILQSAADDHRISIDDLKAEWKNQEWTTDSDEIALMLKEKFKFSNNDIDDVFTQVLNDRGSEYSKERASSGTNSAVLKLVNYIRKTNLTKPVVDYMQQEFGKELTQQGKPGLWQKAKNFGNRLMGKQITHEDIRKIFTLIIKEGKSSLYQDKERVQLGRNRK